MTAAEDEPVEPARRGFPWEMVIIVGSLALMFGGIVFALVLAFRQEGSVP